MDELWGEVRPVPEIASSWKAERPSVPVASRRHTTTGDTHTTTRLLRAGTGHLFAGDVAGCAYPGQSYVKPPTPRRR